MSKNFINAPKVAPLLFSSHAVRANKTIYLSGQISRDSHRNLVGKSDVEKQTAQILENMKAVLEAAGASLNDIVKVTTYVTSSDYITSCQEVRKRYFKDHHPASTFMIVSGFLKPEFLVQIEILF